MDRMSRTFGWILALSLPLAPPAAAAPPLAIAYTPQNEPPYALTKNGELESGLIHDIAVDLADRLHRSASFVLLSRNRIESALVDGTADLYCGYNPAWAAAPERLRWSPPLWTERDVFVLRAGSAPVEDWPDLRGRRIGTILGYRYAQALEAMFATGAATRDDTQSVESNLERLDRGWVDVAVASEVVLRYQVRSNPVLPKFEVAALAESSNAIYCATAARADLPADAVTAAFDAMLGDGSIDRILARYR